MAKLYYYYSSVNAGKSSRLAQSNYNYLERGMATQVFTPEVDDRFKQGMIYSRLGLAFAAYAFKPSFDFFEYMKEHEQKAEQKTACVLVDEAQFLRKEQVKQLGDVVDYLNIPVLAYGIRNDFQGELFQGSQYLLAWADEIKEIKTMCHCGQKATMLVRLQENGEPTFEGPQIVIGGNELHLATCRLHHKEGVGKPLIKPDLDTFINANPS